MEVDNLYNEMIWACRKILIWYEKSGFNPFFLSPVGQRRGSVVAIAISRGCRVVVAELVPSPLMMRLGLLFRDLLLNLQALLLLLLLLV